jgi:hypothetical protein
MCVTSWKVAWPGEHIDTNAALAGQIMGTYNGLSNFSGKLTGMFTQIKECDYILKIAQKLSVIRE